MQMLAVNWKVSSYCEHLPFCNLQTVKSTKKVSRLRKSPEWKKLFKARDASDIFTILTFFGDGSLTIWHATRAKSLKMVKTFPPLEPSPGGLVMGKTKLYFVHSGQSYGGSKSNVSKNVVKVPNFGADLGVGSQFGLLRRQKRLKSIFFFQNHDFAGLVMGKKKFNFGHSDQSYKHAICFWSKCLC